MHFLLTKFNLKTPGREDDDTETKLYTKADVNARKEAGKAGEAAGSTSADPVSEAITAGLGGKKNISDVQQDSVSPSMMQQELTTTF